MNLLRLYFIVSWLPSLLRQNSMPVSAGVAAISVFSLGGIIGSIRARTLDEELLGHIPVMLGELMFCTLCIGATWRSACFVVSRSRSGWYLFLGCCCAGRPSRAQRSRRGILFDGHALDGHGLGLGDRANRLHPRPGPWGRPALSWPGARGRFFSVPRFPRSSQHWRYSSVNGFAEMRRSSVSRVGASVGTRVFRCWLPCRRIRRV
jgi:hypothetical protein